MSLSCLKNYTILYATDTDAEQIDHEFAYTLRQMIAQRAEITLPVVIDAAKLAEASPKIFMGTIAKLSPAPAEYILQKDQKGDLLLAAGSTAAYDDLLKDFLQAVIEVFRRNFFQLFRNEVEGLRDDRIEHHIHRRTGLSRTRSAEFKLVSGKCKRTGTVAVSRITRQRRQHIGTDLERSRTPF